MIYNQDIHKHYIDRQHAVVRKLNLVVVFLIAAAVGMCVGCYLNIVKLTEQRDQLMYQLEKCRGY